MGFPGPNCALCYTLFSAAAIVCLLVIGGGLYGGYNRIDATDQISNKRTGGVHAFIVAAIYAGCLGFCTFRVLCLRYKAPPPENFNFDDNSEENLKA